MSAYVVNDKTISAIVKGFTEYCYAEYNDGEERSVQAIIFVGEERQRIGQSLLNENYRSVNFRYGENTEPRHFQFEDVPVDEGVIYGCVESYIYQACETEDFYDSPIYKSLMNLKEGMLRRCIEKLGYDPDGWDL